MPSVQAASFPMIIPWSLAPLEICHRAKLLNPVHSFKVNESDLSEKHSGDHLNNLLYFQ